jgi:hypothetical protein
MLTVGAVEPERANPLGEDADVQHYAMSGCQVDRGVHGTQSLLIQNRIYPDTNEP